MEEVNKYLAKVQQPQKKELERVRKIIKKAVPEAEEAISYGMPAFRYKKKYLIAYAPFRDHMSVFPGAGAVALIEKDFSDFSTTKGTVHFTIEKPLPETMIAKMLNARIAEINK